MGVSCINSGDPISRIEIEYACYKNNADYEFPSKETISKYISVLQERNAAVNNAQNKKNDDELLFSRNANDDTDANLLKVSFYFIIIFCNKICLKNLINFKLQRLLTLQHCLDGSTLSLDDQNFLWNIRYKICNLFPQTIIVLADCAIIWRDREKTCEFYAMLNQWPELHVETAIELLDKRFVDNSIRELAVKNLDRALNNEELHLHLLALIQVMIKTKKKLYKV